MLKNTNIVARIGTTSVKSRAAALKRQSSCPASTRSLSVDAILCAFESPTTRDSLNFIARHRALLQLRNRCQSEQQRVA
jgi:hypothetical protein